MNKNKKHQDVKRPSSAPITKSNCKRPIVETAWQEKESPVNIYETGKAKGCSSSEESLMHAIHTMQNKYTQNMEVIGNKFKIVYLTFSTIVLKS